MLKVLRRNDSSSVENILKLNPVIEGDWSKNTKRFRHRYSATQQYNN